MAFSSSHWTIDYSAKTVTNNDSGTGANLPHDAGGTYQGEILEFFQWLASEFASTGQMDDTYPIVSDTPTVYKWVNGWAFGHADDYKYLTGGDITSSDGDEEWKSVYTIGSPVAGSQIYITQDGSELTPWWYTGNIDVLINVKTGGTYIQSDDTTGTPTDAGIWLWIRDYGDFYNHRFVNLVNGRSPIGLDTSADAANTTAQATVGAYGITIGAFGTISRDLNNGNGAQNYDVEIDCNGKTMDEVYEYLKWATSYDYGITINSDDGMVYRSANEGSYAEVKVAPFGTIAGGTLYGARGIWFTNYSSANFVLIDSSGTVQAPPNYQKVNCNHPSLVGCNIFVAEESGGVAVKDQYTINSTTASTIVATTTIDNNKTPQTGIVRVGDIQYSYTGYTGSTLTGVSPSPSGETGDFYIPFLDVLADTTTELSDNIIQSGDISVITSVRKYGFKPYDVVATFGSAGLTFTPILANDPQAT